MATKVIFTFLAIFVRLFFANAEISENFKVSRPISDSDYPWTYKCVHDTMDGPACQRQTFDSSTDGTQKVPLKVCILTCGPYGAQWPYPTQKVLLGDTLSNLSLNNIIEGTIDIPENNGELISMTQTAINIFRENLRVKLPQDYQAEPIPNRLTLNIVIKSLARRFNLETNESYTLQVSIDGDDPNSVVAKISAETFFGARHGLESLAQLVEINIETKVYQVRLTRYAD